MSDSHPSPKQEFDDDRAVIAAVRQAFLSSPLRAAKVSMHHNVVAAFVVVEHPPPTPSSPAIAPPYVIGMGSGTRSVGFAKFGNGNDNSDTAKLRQWRKQRLFTLDDGHAEVMARRALQVYLLREMERLMTTTHDDDVHVPSPIQFDLAAKMFVWKPRTDLHLVVTQIPCGAFGVTPTVPEWSTGAHVLLVAPPSSPVSQPSISQHASCSSAVNNDTDALNNHVPLLLQPSRGVKVHMGHTISLVMDESLHLLRGATRTKPGAGTPSLSMSCSDKILRWSVEGVEGKCLRPLMSSTKGVCVVHIARRLPRRSSDAHCDSQEGTHQCQSWEADVQESLQAAAAAGGRMSSTVCPRISWFKMSDLDQGAANNEATECGEGSAASIASWPTAITVQPTTTASCGLRYSWSSTTINTKDGVVHGMTRSRFLTSVTSAQTAAATSPIKEALLSASRAAFSFYKGSDDPAYSPATEGGGLPKSNLCALGCGGAPILRWTLAILSANVIERLNAMNVGAMRSAVGSLAEITSPGIMTSNVRDDDECEGFHDHPYFAFKAISRLSSSQKHHSIWVNKWDALSHLDQKH
ncbi:adenosine deaminase, putative [Bodo saltans]|uniref:tRNA-specific adenosine deaminase 1 n=1 Tax=Bodo saltans TaxID=75058 RepID=A0A0S4KLJ7_BODSA|nr:adenosine deaminase, putative [Bodo saltans]|eukprot:CUI15285.1 adenosine deaminase, putative [Bodo saltans]